MKFEYEEGKDDIIAYLDGFGNLFVALERSFDDNRKILILNEDWSTNKVFYTPNWNPDDAIKTFRGGDKLTIEF